MKNKRNLKLITLILTFFTIFLASFLYYSIFHTVIFKHRLITLEINQKITLEDNIKNLNYLHKSAIKFDDSKLDYSTIGTYPVFCIYQNKSYSFTVKIVDTTPPNFECVSINVNPNEKIEANSLVKNIEDQSSVNISFETEPDTSTPGEYTVNIIARDSSNNMTKKTAHYTVLEPDTTPPIINGTKDLTTSLNVEPNYLENITVSDDRDANPQITVNTDEVNLQKPGTYTIIYTAIDQSGNKTTKTQHVTVYDNFVENNAEKIVYLTFDDGPSYNTQKILEILQKYNVKATFFVTGANPSYYYLIKEAYNQGHTIGLHTFSHNYASVYSSINAYFDDLNKIGEIVKNQIGFVPKYIRFPGGSSNTVSKKYCNKIMTQLAQEVHNKGYEYYDWNVSSGDADGNNIAVNKLIKQATGTSVNKAMILFHDTSAKDTTVTALPSIIEYYKSKGYKFEGISEHSYVSHHGINN